MSAGSGASHAIALAADRMHRARAAPRAAPGAGTPASAAASAGVQPAGSAAPAAVDRIADDREARRAPGARGSGACARSRAARAPACARESAPSRGSASPPGGRRRARPCACAALRWRPMGSIDGAAAGHDAGAHREVLARSISRAAIAATSAVCTSGVRATTSSPLVSLSSRCTSPARGTSAELRVERQQRILQRVRAGCRRPGARPGPAGLLITSSAAILEDDIERQRLRRDLRLGRDARLDAHLLAAQHLVPSPAAAARRPAPRRPRSMPCRRAREYCGRAARQRLVEAQPGRSGGSCKRVRCGTRRRWRRSEVRPGNSLYCLPHSGGAKPQKGPFQMFSVPNRRAAACSRCASSCSPSR